MSVRLSPNMEQLGSPLDGFPCRLKFQYFMENISRQFKVQCNLTIIAGTLHEELRTFVITSR